MPLTRHEREEFLAEPHIAAISIDSGDPGRAPVSVPIWYQYAPGGDLWILTGTTSRKAELIAAAGRFTLLVDRVEPTVRYVSVEGPVISTAPADREHIRELAARYLPAEKVSGYLDFAAREQGDQLIVHMRPERWITAELGSL
ncbi:pyridoxamine 5'-phosphate oxidase family protein [Streptomyces sp. NPDC127068]|uniref:pyridoxamine 5'-phosphate oxidase family protein n=1 Tax=Streptomyces sp. NPDC127068 TaxID=3347127 RepID=UPI0036476CF7